MQYKDKFNGIIQDNWMDCPQPSFLAGEIETESYWNANATLSTSREYGTGLVAITQAFKKDGSIRFDALAETRNKFKTQLAGWSWQNVRDPHYQLLSFVLVQHLNYSKVKGLFGDDVSRISTMGVAYNAGLGRVLSDRSYCLTKASNKLICNRWFNGVDAYSKMSKDVMPGYGRSPFQISRDYPVSILKKADKYKPYMFDKK